MSTNRDARSLPCGRRLSSCLEARLEIRPRCRLHFAHEDDSVQHVWPTSDLRVLRERAAQHRLAQPFAAGREMAVVEECRLKSGGTQQLLELGVGVLIGADR